MAATTIKHIRTATIATAMFVAAAMNSYSQISNESGPGSLIVSSLESSPQQAVLLKKTDRVLIGSVRLNGNYYEIEIADQSRVSIPRDQVEYVGANAEDVYQHKCRNISRWRTGDHFQLTRWCLQNQLLVRAIDHFEEVERQSPNHPAVKQLGAELEQKILSDEKFREFAGLPPLPAAAIATATPKSADSVALASASSQMAEHPQIGIYFNDRIQPILMNRCSQSACHGATSNNSLRLIEPRGNAYARVSSENLKRVLALVEPDESGTPKLLSYATKPHGSQQRVAAIAISETALIEEMKKWIRFSQNPVVSAVATQGPLATSPTTEIPSTLPSSASKLNPLSLGSTQLRSVPGSTTQVEFPAGTNRPAMSEIDALDAQLSKILPREKSASSASQDPFDPAEFNRQAEKPTNQPR